jgi:hypothetical protein
MYTREKLLEEYNKYLLNDNNSDKDELESVLMKRKFLLDKCFPLPSEKEFEDFDNRLKEYVKKVHRETINFYESVKSALGEDWEIESYIYPKVKEGSDVTIYDILTLDNPSKKSVQVVIDRVSSGDLSDFERTDDELFILDNGIDNWGDYDLPWNIRETGLYRDLHISWFSHWFRIWNFSMTDLLSIPEFESKILLRKDL